MFLAAALTACAGPGKEDAKGQVDDSPPPAIPTELGKADGAAKVVAIDVHSPHPYANDQDRVFAVSLASLPACAQSARLHFAVLRTEAGYDYVSVEPVGEPAEAFTGTHDDTWSGWFAINAPAVDVRLATDGSITRHGFAIDKLEWDGAPEGCVVAAVTCDAGEVDIAKPAGPCECPPAPVCAPLAAVEVAHQLARGFNNTTKRVRGATATYTHPGLADGSVTDTIGTIDTTRLAALVRRAVALGVLHGSSYAKPVPADTFLDRLTIRAGAISLAFTASQGAHTAAVQQLITDFEALFTCGGGEGALTCGADYACSADGACVVDEGCVCPAVYEPVCSASGVTYSNGCAAACANVTVAHAGECGAPGDMCGGMQGLPCTEDNRCRYDASTFTAPWPDASGTCVAPTYCDAPADCTHLPHVAVPGAWACETNACAWKTGPAWKPVTGGHFETANPYANNTSVWHQLYLPAEAQALRLRTTRFRTEAGYDKLEVWTWKNGAWALVETYTGSAGPALTDELPGRYHYLRFVSDSSVTAAGVALDAEWR